MAQVLLVVLLLLQPQATDQHWYIQFVKLVGVAIGVWAIITMGRFFNISPRVRDNAPLRTKGPYRFVRHPMHLALLIFCGAFVLGDFAIYTFALWLALLLVLGIKVHYEEKIPRSRFPDYSKYAESTKRIIPLIF